MEQLIEFIEFDVSGRGRRLNDNTASMWYNLNEKQRTFGVTFASNIKTDKKNVKIGKIGDKLCFMFTNDAGINLNKSGKNITFSSKGFIEHVFPEMYQSDRKKDRVVHELILMGQDVYVVKD